MKPITSEQNPRFRSAAKLLSGRGRAKQRRIIIHGEREIGRAIVGGVGIEEVFCRSSLSVEAESVFEEIRDRSVPCWELPDRLFGKLAYGQRDCSLVAVAKTPECSLSTLRVTENALFVVLESFDKPGNIGAVARSADAVAADGVFIANRLCDPFHPNAIRSSTGCVLKIPLVIDQSERCCRWLLENNVQIIAARPDATTSYLDVDYRRPTAVVIGAEATGLSAEWKREGIIPVSIPMRGMADSLNASITAAVLLFEAQRQRSARSVP